MLLHCLKVSFMIYIIIQFRNNSINACIILPYIAQENEFTEVVDESNTLTEVAQKNILSYVEASFKNSPGITQENSVTEVVDTARNLHGISEENKTTEVVVTVIAQANGIKNLIDTSNILHKQNIECLPRSCKDLLKLGGVCKNKDGTIIESDRVFGGKEIYELTFNDTKYLPARSLCGFSIQYLILDDPTVTVDEDVFDGIVQLHEFIVRQSNIQAIPDFMFVKDTIQTINIQSSCLTSLDGRNLQNLTMIKELLFKNNSIRFIHPDVFKGTENVVVLDLSWNRLTSIPSKLLYTMRNLSRFYAEHNNLLHVDNLFSMMSSLQFIELSFNNITDVDSVLHTSMKNVKHLNLSGNPIKNLTVKSFRGKIDKVQELFLSHCEIQKFSFKYFHLLDDLETLDLSYNLIEEAFDAYPESFINKNDDWITLKLNTFNLNGNKLKSISRILEYKQIDRLQVAKNQIQYLSDNDLRFVYETKHLELQENQIRWIDRGAFQHIRKSLIYLDLSSNSISSLNRSMLYLFQLRTLNLASNLIQSLGRDEFTGLGELSHLYLQHNRLKILWQLRHLPNLRYLNITDNDFEIIMAGDMPKNLKRMDLAGNNFKCDCRLLSFLYRLDSIHTDVDLCSRPNIGSRPHKNSNCPEMCSCECAKNEYVYFMSVDCSSKSLSSVPQFLTDSYPLMEANETITSNGQRHLVMRQNIDALFHLEDRVLAVNLENNSFKSLEGIQLPTDLTELYLANNNLTWLPKSIVDNKLNLEKVSLSGNPWNCDCGALIFKRWLDNLGQKIQDIQHVRCGTSGKDETALNGKIIWSLQKRDICPDDPDLTLLYTLVSVGTLIVCLATIFLLKKYNLNIKMFLYSRGFTFVREKDLDYDKLFDAFVSFSHQDDKFVIGEIISVIEEKVPNIHLCMHYRHFMPGEYIYDNIIWAVKNSKKTVLILSKNFLESEWCLMEFRTAHIQALEDKMHRIIVIKLGDLPKKIDPAIKAYLDSTTYLTWGEKYFWNKLLYVLPTISGVTKPLQEI